MRLPRPRRAVVLTVAAGVVAAATAFGLPTAYAYAGDVPRGTSVLGVDIGAMSRAEATGALQSTLDAHADALAAPVPVQVGEVHAELDPAEIGLTVDVDATVARAADSAPSPFGRLYGTRSVPPVVEVDRERLHERLQEEVDDDVGEAMTMPEITFDGTEPVPVYPEPGLGLAPEQSAQALTGAWPQFDGAASGQWRDPTVVTIPLADIHPVTTAEQVDQLITGLAEPAVAAPVEIAVSGEDTIEASPEAIAASLDLTADAQGEIIPEVDEEALREALADQLDAVETSPVDATVVLSGGAPTVVESTDGTEVDLAGLAPRLLDVLPEPEPREVTAETVTLEPELDTDGATALGVTERVSTFTTNFEGGLSRPRNHNIATVAEMVDGALVKPGDVFSLNGYTGKRGYEEGFVDAPVILDGKLTPAVGGGISQFTTTLFNAAYYAGLEDVEHYPHSYYYSRYPAVIEATIFYPSLDMKFGNNTDYGVLIDTSYDNDSITVSMWSTAVWDDVTTEYESRRNITQPERQYIDPGPDCIATAGIQGFTQTAWRIFYRDGIEVNREEFTWRYDPQPEFVCGEPGG